MKYYRCPKVLCLTYQHIISAVHHINTNKEFLELGFGCGLNVELWDGF